MHDYGWSQLAAADRRTILSGFESGKTLGGPYHLEVHPTDRCSISCVFCSTRRIRRGAEIDEANIDRLLEQAVDSDVRSISISGGGEPLFGRAGRRLIQRMENADLPIAHLTTNGVDLDEEVAVELLAARCEQVRISLNTIGRDDYSRMMRTRPELFDRVVRNVRRLSAGQSVPMGVRPLPRRVTVPCRAVPSSMLGGSVPAIPRFQTREWGADF